MLWVLFYWDLLFLYPLDVWLGRLISPLILCLSRMVFSLLLLLVRALVSLHLWLELLAKIGAGVLHGEPVNHPHETDEC